jgi:hypothetical protein
VAEHVTITVAVEGGKTHLTDWQKSQVAKFLASRNGKNVLLKISAQTSPRSVRQNRKYWAVLGDIADDTGNTSEDLHVVFKDMFLPRKFIRLGNHEKEVRKTTTDLSTAEFAKYLDQIIAFAATEMGIRIEPL